MNLTADLSSEDADQGAGEQTPDELPEAPGAHVSGALSISPRDTPNFSPNTSPVGSPPRENNSGESSSFQPSAERPFDMFARQHVSLAAATQSQGAARRHCLVPFVTMFDAPGGGGGQPEGGCRGYLGGGGYARQLSVQHTLGDAVRPAVHQPAVAGGRAVVLRHRLGSRCSRALRARAHRAAAPPSQRGGGQGQACSRAQTLHSGRVRRGEHAPPTPASQERDESQRVSGARGCPQAFLEGERLEDSESWFCKRCKKLVQADKKLDLWSLPEVLVVHLKRFSYSHRFRDKIDVLVKFPLAGLDLSGATLRSQVRRMSGCSLLLPPAA